MIGFFPAFGLSVIVEFVRSRKLTKEALPEFNEKFPLTRLDGVSIYNRERLVDEGIENLENLAHGDLIELMLDTRIPLGNLVDWIDQSILYLHFLGGDQEQGDSDLTALRSHGIRNASDLEAAFDKALDRDNPDADERTKTLDRGSLKPGDHVARFLGILDAPRGLPRLQSILDAISDDDWMLAIRRYRSETVQAARLIVKGDIPEWDQGLI